MENDYFDEQINSASYLNKNNTSKINPTSSSSRPDTPHIDLLTIRNIKKNEPDQIIKNFSSFVKQIIDSENEKFLNGEINLIEYIISKYTNININNLNDLEKLSIKINAEFGLLNQFGQKLPNLKELRLNGSNVINISSIGTEFRNLKILQVNNCNIKDLSGMVCFSSLEVLEAMDNKIDDLIELEMCSTLKKLNLKNNLIKEEDNIFFLSGLIDLKYLNLNGNPIQANEKYKSLINDNLNFIEKIDVEDIESPNINSKNINDLLNSKTDENSLDITNGSKDTNNQSKINSTFTVSDGNISLRPPSSNTLSGFYKKDKNSFTPFKCKNNIFDSNQLTKTAVEWKHNKIENEMNVSELDSNKKVLQGIKSILSQNRKCLNDISIIKNNNEMDNSFNSKLEKSHNIKGFSDTSRIFSSKGTALNPLKPIISLNKNSNADEKKPILIKKPVVIKTSINTKNNITDASSNNFNISSATPTNDISMNSTSGSFIKIKKEVSQTSLKPIVFRKIDKLINENNLNESNNLSSLNEKEGAVNFPNSNNKIIIKNKAVIIKTPNINSSLAEESNSPKKISLDTALTRNKDSTAPIKMNKISNNVRISIDEEK